MNIRNDKMQRLTLAAQLYYEQDKTQNEIAQQLGVSRPLVSRMLREAKDLGIVEIRIHTPDDHASPVLNQAKNVFGIRGGVLVPDASNDNLINQALAASAVEFIQELGGERLGLGWGHIIGEVVSILEQQPPAQGVIRHICPMVGNSGISIRNYHSNENVRIISQHILAEPHYLYTPAFAETRQELELMRQTAHYKAVYEEWERLDIALVNIGNHPSTPDFASVARYGALLSKKHAVGRLIAYYCNQQGEIIQSDTDYAIQIPIPVLAKCRHVVGICSANVNWRALVGALNTGLVTHVVAREQLMREALENRQ